MLSLLICSTFDGHLDYFQFESIKILPLGTFLCAFGDIYIGLRTQLKPYKFLMNYKLSFLFWEENSYGGNNHIS